MVAFWIVLATAVVALCVKRTHGGLLAAVGLAFLVGIHLGTGAVGHSVDAFVLHLFG